jgi:signal transduction histidine kinase
MTQPVYTPHPDTTTPPGAIGPLYHSAFESLTSSLIVFDRGMNILLQNNAAKALLPPASNVAEVLSSLSIEGAYVDWPAELRSIIQSHQPRHFDAIVPTEKDRSETYLHIVISPLRNQPTGEAIGGLLLADDVSSRISMERRLAVSERMAAVGKLAARVAHELNNPLDGILRYTNLAIRRLESVDDPKIADYLEHARTGIVRMGQIVGALLEFSRSTPSTFEQATIKKIIEDALTAMDGRARDANVTIVCNYHRADLPVVRGSSIFQVCCNLIKNAIDAMPDGGTLTIITDVVGPDVVIIFEDTGIGLPEDEAKIFEPFFTTKERGQGTGLGLAVCRELIQRYAGSITAARREPRGSSFTVKIPTRNCAPSATTSRVVDSPKSEALATPGEEEQPAPAADR